MKSTIIYILIALIFISGLGLAIMPQNNKYKTIITTQCTSTLSTSQSNQCKAIFTHRMNDYGLKGFAIKNLPQGNGFAIGLRSNKNLDAIKRLLSTQGNFGLYETYDRNEVTRLLPESSTLKSMLVMPSENEKSKLPKAVLGYCKAENMVQVSEFIKNHYVSKSGNGIQFVWTSYPDKEGNFRLYLLHHDAALSQSDILNAKAKKTKHNSYALYINFNENGKAVFQKLSGENIGKSIAIVIDNKVIAAPIVNSEIKNGKCEITGNFTFSELNYMKSLINSQPLPYPFNIQQ